MNSAHPSIFLYARISTDEQRAGWSLDAQAQELSDRARPLGEPNLYSDIATGRHTRRPGLRALRRALKSAHAPVILAWRCDRLSRSQSDFWRLISEIESRGGYFLEHTSGLRSDDPQGRLMFGIQVAIAEHELATLSQRVCLGMRSARSHGRHCGSAGYGAALEDGLLRLDPQEAAILRKIHGLRKSGASYAKIAQILNDSKIPTKRGGKRWYASTIKSILKSAASLLLSKGCS